MPYQVIPSRLKADAFESAVLAAIARRNGHHVQADAYASDARDLAELSTFAARRAIWAPR